MNTKNKICIVCPSLQMGGIESAMTTLANFFDSKGYSVAFITLFPFEKFFKLNENILLIEPPFDFKKKGRTYFDYLKYYTKLFFFVRRNVKKLKPDSILSFGDYIPAFVLLSLIGFKASIYISNRSNPLIKYNLAMTALRKTAYFLKKPKGVIAQTERAAERKRKIFGSKTVIKIIPNPVRRIDSSVIEKKLQIVGIGRLHYDKGFDRLIEAFSKISSQFPEWNLALAGSGPELEKLKLLANKFDISNKVLFLGKVTNIDALLSESSIFVLPSRFEGFPNALCESMSAGLPCISFDIVAGPSDIITNNENGLLVENNNIIELADKIKSLIENPEKRKDMGKKAVEKVQELSLEKVGNQYLSFILDGKE